MNREQLVESAMPILCSIAAGFAERTPVDYHEFHAAALWAAHQASERYQPESGVPFWTYAKHRIRGACLDLLRSADEASRDARRHAHAIDNAQQALEQRFMRQATSAEIAEAMGVSMAVLGARQLAAQPASSLEKLSDPLDQYNKRQAPWEPAAPETDELGWQEVKRLLDDVQLVLKPRYRRLLEMYYLQEMPMHAIGEVMGVNESRISQLHKAAVGKLREELHRRGFTRSLQVLPRAA